MKLDGNLDKSSGAASAFTEDEPLRDPVAAAKKASHPLDRVYRFHEEPTDALVVCCADPRFLDAIDQFLDADGVHNPAIIAVPGSVKAVGLQMVIPKQWNTLRHQLELMAERNAHVPRVILFTHEDCKSYAASLKMLQRVPGFTSVTGAQRSHLLTLAGILQKQYLPSARVELYHATIVPQGAGKGVKFERIVGK